MKTALKFLLFVVVIVIYASPFVSAQAETLTNASIVEMTGAGLSAEIILRKMSTAGTRFDISSTALIELKKAGVAEEVIAAMIDRSEAAASGSPVASQLGYSDSDTTQTNVAASAPPRSKREMIETAKTIAFVKSSLRPSRQALEKETMKRPEFIATKLTITRYKESADLYVEIGYVSLSWITHRYVYRIFDRRTGTVLGAGETTSWGSLAKNLARNIARSLADARNG